MNEIGLSVGPDYLSRLNSSIRSAIQLARRDLLNINDFTLGVKLHAQNLPKRPEDKYISSLSDYHKILTYLISSMDYDISRKLIKTFKRIDSANHTDTGKPKTPYSISEVPVGDDVLDILSKLHKEQENTNILELSSNLIFFDKRYGLPTNNEINKALKTYLTKLNITPLIVATGCRHTYACVLLYDHVLKNYRKLKMRLLEMPYKGCKILIPV